MRNNFTLIWSFRNRIDELTASILSADITCPKSINFLLVDASSDMSSIYKLREFIKPFKNRNIRIVESFYRSSLSEAWNLGMMLCDTRYVIFASSDTFFKKKGWDDIFKQQMLTKEKMEYVLIENHALFALDRFIIPKMGWFDENYKIGPHFDSDYMLRARENNIKFAIFHNDGFYSHGDTEQESKERFNSEVKDRLPMNGTYNEEWFMKKWKSNWPGWISSIRDGKTNLPHPPTHISQAKRILIEEDPHPVYTKKLKEEYENLNNRS